MTKPCNALINETSPYLLQHADNPVHWYAWGDEALNCARQSDRPILLSVGYSACHWCHVMAHESFEDEATAALMNSLFVNIKVDREERPDLDKIYQLSHQLLTQRAGGWPLTMFLSPDDLTPFFGGTYFPLQPRFGMPAFKEILTRVAEFFDTHRAELTTQNKSLVTALQKLEPQARAEAVLTANPLNQARAELEQLFEPTDGGFGGAPKFPHPTNLERLLRHYALTANQSSVDQPALDMVTFTLRKMADGGLYDHVGGGFSRYSVDGQWMIPHFEKMLYDNGPLLCLYADAYQLMGQPRDRRTIEETATWVLREMQSPLGGYYSALDADSEGEEGKYYVWTPDEVQQTLSVSESNIVMRKFGLDREPNFENHAWHFHCFVDDETVCKEFSLDETSLQECLSCAKQKLFRKREQRIRPGLDDKCLTSWNALMIKGMIRAGQICEEPKFIDSAEHALEFVRKTLWHDGRLFATSKDGRAHLAAYLDDYAFLLEATLQMLQHRWDTDLLHFATELADVLIAQFEDPEQGGFFFTAHDHEELMYRPKPMMDDALPAGNGIAAYALNRLGHLTGDFRYLQSCERTLLLAATSMSRVPHAHNALLLALEEYLQPSQLVILRGSTAAIDRWHRRANQFYAPRRLCFSIPRDCHDLPGLLSERKATSDDVVAYLCNGHQCDAPITDFDFFCEALKSAEVAPVATS